MRKMMMRTLCAAMAMSLCFGGCAEQSVGSERMLEIERALYSLGYHDDNFDALLDDMTRKALRSFQAANDFPVTGEADSATLALLDSGMGITRHQYLVELKDAYANLPILQSGSSGESVSALQNRLKTLGYFSGECDGMFGDATLAAVKRFQMANGLTETGTADRSTQYRLNEGTPLSWQSFLESSIAVFGYSGLHGRQLQRRLKDLGYFGGDCTGNFGELTRQAVSAFQERNGVEITGIADLTTVSALYTGTALPLKDPQTLRMGDSSESVSQLQSLLASYGFYDRNITGVYGATTEIAVRLFQMAHEKPVTGEVDADMMSLLSMGSSMELDWVREAFSERVRGQNDGAKAVIGSAAQRLRGQSFEPDDEDLYEGFAFVQYVCVLAGIPVVAPEDVLEMATEPVTDYSAAEAGDILVFRGAEDQILMAVCAGNGNAVYATQDSGYVLETNLRSMNTGELYRWNMKAVGE